jgi:peptidoglycan/xylan/chitin deacetylase (PgdA/CDA1 family)
VTTGLLRSAILTYHSLENSGSVISTTPEIFRSQIESLAESGIPVVSLDELLSRPGAVAITFDDGYRNLVECAFPVLERFGVPATVFVVSRYCGLLNGWPSQTPGVVPELPLMSWEELAAAPRCITFGAHTATHPRLPVLTPAECDREMSECREEIEQRLARPVRWLAYPYGSCSAGVCSSAARHFELAVGTSLRFVSPAASRMNLPRLDMYYFRDKSSLSRLFSPATRGYVELRNAAREARDYLSHRHLWNRHDSD